MTQHPAVFLLELGLTFVMPFVATKWERHCGRSYRVAETHIIWYGLLRLAASAGIQTLQFMSAAREHFINTGSHMSADLGSHAGIVLAHTMMYIGITWLLFYLLLEKLERS